MDERKVYNDAELAEKRREAGLRDKDAAIRAALERLDHDNDRHWTKQRWPSVPAVAEMCDFEVTRADVTRVAPDFQREQSK